MLTALVFLTVFVILLGLTFVRHPIYGVYLYFIVFYVHPPSSWWGRYLPDLRWSLVSAVALLLALVFFRARAVSGPGRLPRQNLAPAIGLLLFVGYLWIQNLWALDFPTHLDATIQFTKYAVIFCVLLTLLRSEADVTNLLLLHVSGCLYLGLLALAAPSSAFIDGRLNGVGGPGINDANTLAMFLGTGAITGAALMLTLRGWRQYFCMVAMPFILNGMVLAGSRGAFIGVVAAGIVLFWAKPKGTGKLFLLFAGLAVVLASIVFDARFIGRIFSIGAAIEQSEEIDGSAESRLKLIDAQLRMAANYPHGAGHKGTAVLAPNYLDERWFARSYGNDSALSTRSSHNTFMTLLVEQGLFGAGLYIFFLAWWAKGILRLVSRPYRQLSRTLGGLLGASYGALTVVVVSGLFTDYLLAEVQIWMLAIIMSLQRIGACQATCRLGHTQPKVECA